MDTIAPNAARHARQLAKQDLDAVVGIDARVEGRTRRTYFERRLAAALREPDLHVQVAIDDDQGLVGYMLGRVMEGEFGRAAPSIRLETLGVRPWSDVEKSNWVTIAPETVTGRRIPPHT